MWVDYRLRILHIGDQAGSAAQLSYACSKLGHPSHVIQDVSIDTFRIGEYYKNTEYVDYSYFKDNMPESNIDHIIYHDQFELANMYDFLHIPSSFVFHGNMLRQQPVIFRTIENLESIDNIFVTTEDMLKYGEAELLNRPVDIDLFKPLNIDSVPIPLCLSQERYFNEIRELCSDLDDMILMDRVKHPTQYSNMPLLLNSHRMYIDLKFQPTHPPSLIPELSQTGLQALACEIPVRDWRGEIQKGLLKRHYAENVAREFIRVLEE